MQHGSGPVGDPGSGQLVKVVGEERGRAGARLDAHLQACGHQHLCRLRDEGDPALSLLALLGDGHLHDSTTLRNPGWIVHTRKILNSPHK